MITIGACKKKSAPSPPAAPDHTPAKALLIFPAKDEACITGSNASSNTSSVVFSWNGAANADAYEVNVKNLTTGAYMPPMTTSNTQLTITLLKNTSYSWFINSKSSLTSATTQSDTWKFYNSGPGEASHPPFPADLLTPSFGQSITPASGKISLSWIGGDVDNDISSYDIYFGTISQPPLYQSNVQLNTLNGISAISNTTYFWKIVTWDSKGNNSTSSTYQFTVN